MKRVLSIVLAAVMLLMSQGMAFGTHFCGGKAVLHQLMAGMSAMDCGMPGMDTECLAAGMEGQDCLMAEGCCRDNFLSLEINDAFKPVVPAGFDVALSAPVPAVREQVPYTLIEIIRKPLTYSSPPSRGQPPLHVRFETFLI